jgi:hypothetical protein
MTASPAASPGTPSDRIVSVERVIAAPAEKIFDVLADPRRHRDVDGSGTVVEILPDTPARLSAGATFGMAMKFGVRYQMLNRVVEFQEGRRIAWAPKPIVRGKAREGAAGRIWRYELEPVPEGTRVRETWDATDEKGFFVQRVLGAPKRTARGMAKSLENLERIVVG